jgi:energy-coupling factor transporter transmembrane protein EcfT
MTYSKNMRVILFVSTLLLTILTYFITGDGLGLCNNSIGKMHCVSLVNNIAEPTFWAFIPAVASLFILLFVKKEVFKSWAKFALVSFPIMLLILFYTYNNGSPTGSVGLGPIYTDEDLATIFLPSLFFIVSVVIISLRSHKLRKQS